MAVTIVDIAKKLNISHATVSRVLNGRNKDFISEETRQRVIAAAAEMGYHPNRMARALATGKSNLIALSMPDMSLPFYSRVIKSVQTLLKRDGFGIIPFTNEGSISLRGWPVDGALACDAMPWIGTFLSDSMEMQIPLVTMGSYYVKNSDYVSVDLYAASRDAVEHILGTGRKRIAYIVFEGIIENDSRRAAYHDVLSEAGVEPELITVSDLSRTVVREHMLNYVKDKGCPDGLMCMNDDLAIGAFRALRDLGIKIPEDVGIVGCDGIEDTEYMDPAISTIVQPIEEMCTHAWDFLRNRLKDPKMPQQSAMLQSRLDIRQSSRV